MNNVFNIFSTREIALIIWLFIFLIFVSRTKELRVSIVEVIKAFFKRKLFLAFSTLLVYVLFVIFLLFYIGFWDISLLKDTIFWLLFSGFILFININKAEDVNYFSGLIKDNIKIIVFWEFMFNFYTLSLVGELVFIPLIFLLTTMQAFAEDSSKQEVNHKKVVVLCKKVLGLIGLGIICYVIYKTITEYELLFSVTNFKSFILPVLLVLLTLPYFYLLSLYIIYENFIVIVKHYYNEDPIISKSLIKATFKYANININTLKRIQKYQTHFDSSKEKPDEYIKRVAKKVKYVISSEARLKAFNDIQTVIEDLSNIGIGKLNDWHKPYAGEDCYLSMTNYYSFGIDYMAKIPNTIAFYLTGEETYIKQLDVVLDIGFQQDKHQAIEKFIEVLDLTFKCLDIPMLDKLLKSIILNKEYNKQYDTYSILLNYEKLERIEKYKIGILTTIN
ncbi:hypothetical protein [uncultured Bacteroides sp.]|uniref:hypothetical protein n=1 Tax=uncultured Bacteroides sp. TaxID=162156 RepID=UPI002AAB4724|nr:hypothetical protein [uncultured Bacteroides sp.]